ncbi:vesicle-trafficking protein SEC22c [Nematolebias whitei]|uniref:vesicle-trafficking protein SEC22c n=1 Tax=Nematolebias whitei TaxID=451745 RepID=UPI0018986081|nr:vesicle-trafficking protein SEC22c [Nematolebias whitei]
MSLILFAFVVRVRDGLPLSASTDFEHNRELQERKQQLRTISKSLASFSDRGTIKGQQLNLYFTSSEGVSYMSVCRSSLPAAKAFCFLEDLRWEFTARFDSSVVALAARPYPFLEFDSTIQKLKQQYNQSGGPTLEVTLVEVQDDLRIRPPQVINLEEVELANGTANGHIEQSKNQRLEPVTPPGILSLVLNIVCASLNLIRGVHLMENTLQDDYEGIWNFVAFLFAFVCCAFQCHLFLFHSSQKKLKSFFLLSVIVLCNLYLHGLRNAWQLIFHISVASVSTFLILTRRVQQRTDDCGV